MAKDIQSTKKDRHTLLEKRKKKEIYQMCTKWFRLENKMIADFKSKIK